MLRTLPEGSVGLPFEGSQGGRALVGIATPGIPGSLITGPAGTGLGGTYWEEVCQLMLLSCWGAKGVFRSSSISRSCS